MDDLFNEANIPESNWFKFSAVGDKVAGTLVAIEDKPGKDVFGPQRVFSLKQPDDSIIFVGIPLDKDYVIGRANTAKMGDLLGFQFVKEIPSATKGFSPAKSIEVYVKHSMLPSTSTNASVPQAEEVPTLDSIN
jgi:hypothetical protein